MRDVFVHPDPTNERAANNKKYYIQMLAEQEVDTKGDEGDPTQVWFEEHITIILYSDTSNVQTKMYYSLFYTVYYAEPSHCNLCGTGTCTYTLALYQSRSRSHISSV